MTKFDKFIRILKVIIRYVTVIPAILDILKSVNSNSK